ncbi:MAG: CPBP family intramembrane metalloprotease [Oscillospiraceae bacterium]|nr:CPBP family intramembrane metalloprotease [Oscillospiraceae bacterium]
MKKESNQPRFWFSIGLYLFQLILWAFFRRLVDRIVPETEWFAILDATALKALFWVCPIVLAVKLGGEKVSHLKKLREKPFPSLAFVILSCSVVAILHSIRIINGLQYTHVFFQWFFIASSLGAGIIEEFVFRGYYFALHERLVGFWPAALINGVMFTLFHYPEVLLGQSFICLFSLRGALIFSMSVAFCWMYYKWRNIALNMSIHAIWDLLSFMFCLAG